MVVNKMKAFREFESALNDLVGKECWSITQAAGSWVLGDFGAKVLRDEPVKNDRLSEEQRNYKGEYIVHVLHCAWRIETPQKVLATWRDDNSRKGLMIRTLDKLSGRKVQAVAATYPGLDMAISFEGDITWRTFCDLTNKGVRKGLPYDNYSFRTPSHLYIVEGRCRLISIELDELDDELDVA